MPIVTRLVVTRLKKDEVRDSSKGLRIDIYKNKGRQKLDRKLLVVQIAGLDGWKLNLV